MKTKSEYFFHLMIPNCHFIVHNVNNDTWYCSKRRQHGSTFSWHLRENTNHTVFIKGEKISKNLRKEVYSVPCFCMKSNKLCTIGGIECTKLLTLYALFPNWLTSIYISVIVFCVKDLFFSIEIPTLSQRTVYHV